MDKISQSKHFKSRNNIRADFFSWLWFKNTIEITKQTSSRLFNLFSFATIFVSIFVNTLETLPNLSQNQKVFLKVIEWSCVTFFLIEYLLRILVARNKIKFVFSLYGIIDLLSIVPSLLLISNAFTSLRVLRIFSLFRIFRLLRFISATQHLKRSIFAAKGELFLFFILSTILLYFSSAGIYVFEHEAQPEKFSSVFHSFWWSVITMTTVGYGDIVPITIGGKIFSCFMIFIGVSFVAVPTGILSASLAQVKIKKVS